jgi:hypothetical protein
MPFELPIRADEGEIRRALRALASSQAPRDAERPFRIAQQGVRKSNFFAKAALSGTVSNETQGWRRSSS